MNAQELLDNLNLLDESERIEAKRALDAGKSVLETICAFANEPGLGGGYGSTAQTALLATPDPLSGKSHPLSGKFECLSGKSASSSARTLLLNRNVKTIGQNCLRPLLAQRRIAMTLPDTPNSPLRAYRSPAVS